MVLAEYEYLFWRQDMKPKLKHAFTMNPKSFGIIFRGKSITRINKVVTKFTECIIVNNFDAEIQVYGEYLKGKKVAQMINRRNTAISRPENYRKLGIKVGLVNANKQQKKRQKTMANMLKNVGVGIQPFCIPEAVFKKYIRNYDTAGTKRRQKMKFGNTGLGAICFVIEYIKPKNLYLIGLDLYQDDYYKRYKHQYSWAYTKGRAQVKEIPRFIEIIKNNPQINFHIVTNCKLFPKLDNVFLY